LEGLAPSWFAWLSGTTLKEWRPVIGTVVQPTTSNPAVVARTIVLHWDRICIANLLMACAHIRNMPDCQ
jgi:hypothetical protein